MYEPLYQLARLILLADKMVQDQELDITEARVIVVCPEANIEYRNRITSPPLAKLHSGPTTVETTMKSALKAPSLFQAISQDALVNALRNSGPSPALEFWLDYHAQRYGW